MNLKFLYLSASAATFLMAASPMASSSMSTDNGGTKKAIDAYSDGAGVLVINQASDTKFDNSSMNKLVFKYGDAAKAANTTLKNQVSVLSTSATDLEKTAAATLLETAKLVINPPINGTQCDDGNANTGGDVWLNSVCAGVYIDGVVCDDTNSITYSDKYTNGICSGIYATSCKTIKVAMPSAADGLYEIDIDAAGPMAKFQVLCDMTTDGGGWTNINYKFGPLIAMTATNGVVTTGVSALIINGALQNRYNSSVCTNAHTYNQLQPDFLSAVPFDEIKYNAKSYGSGDNRCGGILRSVGTIGLRKITSFNTGALARCDNNWNGVSYGFSGERDMSDLQFIIAKPNTDIIGSIDANCGSSGYTYLKINSIMIR